MPWVLQKISYIIPARHFIVIVKGIMIKGQGLDTLWPETCILALEALIFIGLSIRQLKPRLE
jgi:ABC-2 type transport system permease protein